VVLLARTTEQLDEARGLLLEQGVPAQRVQVVPADLADEGQRDRAAVARSRRAGSTSWSTTRPLWSRLAPPLASRRLIWGWRSRSTSSP
jgi:hypothetical protein